MEFLPLEIEGDRVYVGPVRRVGAVLLDILVLTPLVVAELWMQRLTSITASVSIVLSFLVVVSYRVAFPAILGGTPGKLILGIRITKPDGSPIGWGEALRRESVDIVLGALSVLGAVPAAWRVAPSEYAALASGAAVSALRKANQAPWYPVVEGISTAWVWVDSGTILFNARRRALHDFIAGTVVVYKRFARASHGASEESAV